MSTLEDTKRQCLDVRPLDTVQTSALDERDRADKALCINTSLGILVEERDFATALLKIMGMWCDALGAQQCYVGRWKDGFYHVVQSYAAPGEELPFVPGESVEYIKSFNDNASYHGTRDYVPMPDFRQHPSFCDFVRVSPNPDSVLQMSSCYSHVIRRQGRPWGTLVLLFRNRHELTRNEEVFLKAAVRGIELSLVRQGYEDEIAADRAREIAHEQDRVDKQRRINESLEILLGEPDLHVALDKIMAMWCEALGAQWCCLGACKNDLFYPLHGYAVKGEKSFKDHLNFAEDEALGNAAILLYHGSSDYLAMPDFQSHPLSKLEGHIFSHPELMQEVSSCYSYVIYCEGRRWGTLVLLFRNRHVLSPDEVGFFKASAKGVELALSRKRYMDELKGERDRALAAEKARSLFFSSVSHDIRTPLNAIVGFSELLEAGVADKAVQDRYVSTIRSSGKMLARLVNDILDLSKLESGKLEIINEPTDLPELVREVSEAFGVARARKSIIFDSDIAPMPRVNVDPQRIRQLLYNLLSNAYKYTDHGRVFLKTAWNDGTLTLSVGDTGKGISKENIARILQPFVQVADRNHRDGTGLGLSICQKLVHLMGGELTIESEIGQGSTFKIALRGVEVVQPSADVARPTSHEQNTPFETKKNTEDLIPRAARILVVDDSPVNRAILKAMLAREGVSNVVTAENGLVALEIIRSDSQIGGVFTDLWMPIVDGEKLVTEIRADARFRHLPVYLVTADVEAVGQYRKTGFTGILLKPISQTGVRMLLS